MALSGAEMIIEALCLEGVTSIWGYPGGAVLPVYDALRAQSRINHFLVRHEQAAVHAADGYARATGRVGVALVTSGPGITNAVTGIATAYFDSIPLVVISGNVPSTMIGEDAFQECDAVGITRPIVKHNFLVRSIDELAPTLKKAFHLASTGRPGPVHIDVPKDIALTKGQFVYPDKIDLRSYRPTVDGHPGQLRQAVRLIGAAQRPLIYRGGGVISSGASLEVQDLAALLNAPVTSTLMGLGAYPASDRRFVGMPGMHGTYEANQAMQECDVLIAIGARFDDRVIGNVEDYCSRRREIIHIDIDPTSIAKRVRPTVPIVGDVKNVLKDLNQLLSDMSGEPVAHAHWWAQLSKWRERKCLAYSQTGDAIKPQYVIEKISELTKGMAYICSDVGQHQMWAAQHFGFELPRRWINSGGLGTMGVGLPYAMGVKHAFPDADVFTITGDGSIQMCIQELSTCKQYGLPIKIASLNNGYLGMVRQLQDVEYEKRHSQSYMEALPDFAALAKAYGHVGLRIEKKSDVEPAIREALALRDRTVFMDFQIDSTENVWPMVRAGRGLSEMLLPTNPMAPETA